MVFFFNNEATREHLIPPDSPWKMTKLIRDGLNFLLELKSDSGHLNVLLLLFVISIPWRYHSISATSVAGILELLLNIGLVIFSFQLWKKVRKNKLVKLRSLIKFGCYLLCGAELLIYAVAFVYFISWMFSKSEDSRGIHLMLFATSVARTFHLVYNIYDRIE